MRAISLALAICASLFALPNSAPPIGDWARDLDFHPRPTRRGKGQNNRRGKGKRNPPKSRPNRLTISKRVRRKHRRAA